MSELSPSFDGAIAFAQDLIANLAHGLVETGLATILEFHAPSACGSGNINKLFCDL